MLRCSRVGLRTLTSFVSLVVVDDRNGVGGGVGGVGRTENSSSGSFEVSLIS